MSNGEVTALIPTCVRCLRRTGERAFQFVEGRPRLLPQLTEGCPCPVGEPDLLVLTPDGQRWASSEDRERYAALLRDRSEHEPPAA